jgi:AraC family transcriptional regulator
MMSGGLPGARLRHVTEFIDDNLGRPLPLAELSAQAHLSPYHFTRLFKQSTGVPPHRFVVRRRIERACALLIEGRLSVDAVARAVGFRTRSHFSMVFHRHTGRPPTVYRAFASVSDTAGAVDDHVTGAVDDHVTGPVDDHVSEYRHSDVGSE